MKVSRRQALVSGAMLAGNLPVAARAVAMTDTGLFVFDSRLEHSRAWAAAGTGAGIDVAQPGHDLWRALRDVSPDAAIAGLTRWSDFLVVRGHLRTSGRRLRHVIRHPGSFEWLLTR